MKYNKLARPMYKLKLPYVSPDSMTKFGGVPDVESDFIWPTIDALQYLFVAQISCEELNQDFYDVGFPKSGMISIFVPYLDYEIDRASIKGLNIYEAKIFYFPEVSKLKPAQQQNYSFRQKNS